MHDFVRKLIQLRKDHGDALAPDDFSDVEVDWRSPYEAHGSGTADWTSRSVIVLYEPQQGKRVVALINMEDFDIEFGIPPGDWVLAVDTQSWYDTPGNSNESGGWFDDHPDADPYTSRNIDDDPSNDVSGTYEVKSRCIVLLVEK